MKEFPASSRKFQKSSMRTEHCVQLHHYKIRMECRTCATACSAVPAEKGGNYDPQMRREKLLSKNS
jgi:hypothetical protein